MSWIFHGDKNTHLLHRHEEFFAPIFVYEERGWNPSISAFCSFCIEQAPEDIITQARLLKPKINSRSDREFSLYCEPLISESIWYSRGKLIIPKTLHKKKGQIITLIESCQPYRNESYNVTEINEG